MNGVVKSLYLQNRELLAVLASKAVVLRYKQAYFGVAWSIFKPIALVLFMIWYTTVIDDGVIFCLLLQPQRRVWL